jgi:hypothetical protein
MKPWVIQLIALWASTTLGHSLSTTFREYPPRELEAFPAWDVTPGRVGITWSTVKGHQDLDLYVPIASREFDANWVASLRHSLHVETPLAGPVALRAKLTTWLHGYHEAGYFNRSGARALRRLVQRLQLGLDVPLASRLHFWFPITLQQARYGDFQPSARFNRRTRYALWIAPRLSYEVEPGLTVSLTYETDTFVASDLSRWYFLDSLGESEVYLKLQISI